MYGHLSGLFHALGGSNMTNPAKSNEIGRYEGLSIAHIAATARDEKQLQVCLGLYQING